MIMLWCSSRSDPVIMRLGWLAGLVLIDRRVCTYLPIQNTKWDSFGLQVKITSTNPNYIAHCTGSATGKPAIKKFRIKSNFSKYL